MNLYDEIYYIALRPPGDNQIYLKADKKTAKRRFRHSQVAPGGPPLYFENAYRDEEKNNWPITDVLMDSSGLLVTDPIYNEIKKYNINSIQFLPSVYVDDIGAYYEDRWYIGFYEELDCLDRNNSNVRKFDFDDDEDQDDDERLEVTKFSLDRRVLDSIEEEKRLMFKIASCSKKYVFVHKKIVDYFLVNQIQGVRFIKVADFEEGMQHA